MKQKITGIAMLFRSSPHLYFCLFSMTHPHTEKGIRIILTGRPAAGVLHTPEHFPLSLYDIKNSLFPLCDFCHIHLPAL